MAEGDQNSPSTTEPNGSVNGQDDGGGGSGDQPETRRTRRDRPNDKKFKGTVPEMTSRVGLMEPSAMAPGDHGAKKENGRERHHHQRPARHHPHRQGSVHQDLQDGH